MVLEQISIFNVNIVQAIRVVKLRLLEDSKLVWDVGVRFKAFKFCD